MSAAWLAAAALATSSAGPATAPDAPAGLPSYDLGDAFVFSDGRVEQVVAVRGDLVSWQGLQGGAYERSRNFVTPPSSWRMDQGEGRRFRSGRAASLWPLSPGKSVRFSVINETRRGADQPWERNMSLWACKVGPRHDTATPAGTFQVMTIGCDLFSPFNMRLLERVAWDYAPDLGHYVRRTNVDYLAARTSSIVLTSALHGAAATRPRLVALANQAGQASLRQP
ncbi:MAG: hypothetical protein ACHP7A_08395 [Caulobacterales bacterium]